MFWENSIETCILSRVKQFTSPGWMHETSARAWCTGRTQRNCVGREVGGGSGWGIHVTPWLIHVNVWQKPLQYCKVISLQLIKINGKKKILWTEEPGSPWGCRESDTTQWWTAKIKFISLFLYCFYKLLMLFHKLIPCYPECDPRTSSTDSIWKLVYKGRFLGPTLIAKLESKF